jgi:DNA transposition AAA+ family ATPase
MSKQSPYLQRPFVVTQEHERFAEFCDACRQDRYIGLCYGYAGVGKTWSARHYARWDLVEPHLHRPFTPGMLAPALGDCYTLFYTPLPVNSPGRIQKHIDVIGHRLSTLIEEVRRATEPAGPLQSMWPLVDHVELLIVDETDWLKMLALEQVRAIYDQQHIGVVLIGMPGIEKRLARYPQLYSRVGFVHHFKAMSQTAIRLLLNDPWSQAIVGLARPDFADEEALSAIIRITGGNFRLLERLLSQIARILLINKRDCVTKDVVEVARQALVIGEA